MKTYGKLFEQIYDFCNLETAYLKARDCKRYRSEVLQFTARKEENLINIQNHLIWKTYRQGPYRTFIVHEPKQRLISALPFRDRVVQHALNNVIEPIFDRRFYFHSYACRRGKGMHKASETLTLYIRGLSWDGKPFYALKCDIHHYFQSVDHARLKQIVRRVISDPDVLWLIDLIIDSTGDDVGIPVGNLSSQLFANVYLDVLDKYVKETLCEKHYLRYMDDFIILGKDKAHLRVVWKDIESFLDSDLHLRLNPKTTIIDGKNGINFCGYRHWTDYKLIRKYSVKKMKRTIRAYKRGVINSEQFDRSIASWMGHIGHVDAYRLAERVKQIYESL